eukprot:48922-Eustigmatos_ZCMA.PRE.1
MGRSKGSCHEGSSIIHLIPQSRRSRLECSEIGWNHRETAAALSTVQPRRPKSLTFNMTFPLPTSDHRPQHGTCRLYERKRGSDGALERHGHSRESTRRTQYEPRRILMMLNWC